MEIKPQNLQSKIPKFMGYSKSGAQKEIYSKWTPIFKKDIKSIISSFTFRNYENKSKLNKSSRRKEIMND